MSIRKKMAHGAFWALLEKGAQQGFSFVVFIVIARIVGPEEMGLVNLCYIYITFCYFVIMDIVDGIVNLQLRDDRRLSTLFWTVIAAGIVMAMLGQAAAAPYAAIMNHADLEPLLRWFAVIPLLIAGSSVPTALVYKSMNFRVFTIRTIIANFIGGVTGIVMAVKGFGAYALVAQQIVMYSVTNAYHMAGLRLASPPDVQPRGFAYRAGARHQDDGIVFRAIF